MYAVLKSGECALIAVESSTSQAFHEMVRPLSSTADVPVVAKRRN
jgi:hypothetical protein